MLLKRLLVLAAVLACAGPARAEEPAIAPDEDHADISLILGPRIVRPFVRPETFAQPLLGYGYGPMSVLFELSAAGSYRVHRYIDVGARASWLFGSAGSTGADQATLTLEGLEAVAFVRPFYRGKSRRAGVGIELAAGVQGGWLSLRGQTVSRASFVAAPTFIAVMAPTRVQPTLRLGPVFAHLGGALAGRDLPTGGLTMTFGGNLSL